MARAVKQLSSAFISVFPTLIMEALDSSKSLVLIQLFEWLETFETPETFVQLSSVFL